LEAEDVELLRRRFAAQLAQRQLRGFLVFELVAEPPEHHAQAAAIEFVRGAAEHLQVAAVVEEDALVEIDDENGVVRRLERRLQQRDGLFLGWAIAHGWGEYDTIVQ